MNAIAGVGGAITAMIEQNVEMSRKQQEIAQQATEASAMMDELLQIFDTNGDGQLTMEELDRNGDGKFTLEDLMMALASGAGPSEGGGKAAEGGGGKAAEEGGDAAEEGGAAAEEAGAAAEEGGAAAEGAEEPAETGFDGNDPMQQLIRALDTNGDGKISQEEFDEADTNGDGMLSGSEIEAAMERNMDNHANSATT